MNSRIHVLLFCTFCFSFSSHAQVSKIESIQTVYLQTTNNHRDIINTASGFIIRSKTRYYMVTNWHVLTNKNSWDQRWCDTSKRSPKFIDITYWQNISLLIPTTREEPLFDKNNKPLWHENVLPNGEMVDVAELPLTDTAKMQLFPVPYDNFFGYNDTHEHLNEPAIEPTNMVYIVGYPLTFKTQPGLPIWKAAMIASEPFFDQASEPVISLDVQSFEGMSGAPVYFISNNYKDVFGNQIQSVGGITPSFFVGIYSHKEHNGGGYRTLWKVSFLSQVFHALP